MSSATPDTWPRRALNAGRGVLIGMAEAVPGVSGGTIALITGVYETVVSSASSVIAVVRHAITDPVRGRGWAKVREHWGDVAWAVMIPLVIGMAVALVVAARLLGPAIEDHPEVMRALFFGLVIASLVVPARMAAHADLAPGAWAHWRRRDVVFALVAAAVTFTVVSLPRAEIEPSPAILVPAGAVAMSALVLPGLSGSFLLLTFGLYEPTIAAVNERDLGYLALFALGCAVGLVTIVKALAWLLARYRRMTLVILTGVMAGSLRALWPWIDESNAALAPSGPVMAALIACAVGIVAVVTVLVVEHRFAPATASANSD